jgi:hypothetical protein
VGVLVALFGKLSLYEVVHAMLVEQADQVLFEEEQSFRQTWIWGLMLGVLVLLLGCFALVVFEAPREEGFLSAAGGLGMGVALVIGVIWLFYRMKLSVRVDRECLHVRFWPWVKKDIRLEEIAQWDARSYRPILEYGGWGVRCSWKGMAYNVSGNRGVQLVFTNGKRLLIGSQRPEELAMAISGAKQSHP